MFLFVNSNIFHVDTDFFVTVMGRNVTLTGLKCDICGVNCVINGVH